MAGPVVIVPARTPGDIADVAGLFREYAAALRVDRAYQDFAGQLAGLPGASGPPGGVRLMARTPSGEAVGGGALRGRGAVGAGELAPPRGPRPARGRPPPPRKPVNSSAGLAGSGTPPVTALGV